MECYRCRSQVYNNGIFIGTRLSSYFLCEESEKPYDGVTKLNWNNVSQFYRSHSLKCNFSLYETQRGKLVSFFDFNIFKKATWDVKEWKSNLDLLVVWKYEKYNPTLDSLLKYPECEKVIKYLKERNIKC